MVASKDIINKVDPGIPMVIYARSGRENAKQFLKENEELRDEIEVKVREEFGLKGQKSIKNNEKSSRRLI